MKGSSLPIRFYIDIEQAQLISKDKLPDIPAESPVLSLRVAQNSPTRVRVVLDLVDDIDQRNFQVVRRNNDLLVQLNQQAESQSVVSVSDLIKEPKTKLKRTSPKETVSKKTSRDKKYLIILDPGHGGEDTGAIGLRGTYEKDVVLSISRKLKKLLENDKNYSVLMTRDRDLKLELSDRTSFANQKTVIYSYRFTQMRALEERLRVYQLISCTMRTIKNL